MKRFLMQIAYDGTDFFGWQIQNEGRTVQQTIERALSDIAKTKVSIVGSGRTDAGVHALNQYAHFDFTENMNSNQIQLALFLLLTFFLLLVTAYFPNVIRFINIWNKSTAEFNFRNFTWTGNFKRSAIFIFPCFY